MAFQFRVAVWLASFVLAPFALAQTSGSSATESTAVKSQNISGVVETVAGNKVVLRQADGLHEYNVPDGFKFQLAGREAGVSEIKPGMTVDAVVTDRITTRQVTTTTIQSGTVAQVAPGGIVVKDQNNEFKSYNFKDAAGNDIYFIRDGKEVSLRNVKVGDRLSGTFVSTLPAQQVSQRTAVARATEPPPPAAPPVAMAAAEPPAKMPKTASPLPLIGLLALGCAGIALALRAVRSSR